MARRARLPGEHLLSQARERALTLLYEADVKGISPREVLANQIVDPDPLTTLLVEGVADDYDLLNEMISANARGWTIERMPSLDRAVLRLAITELRKRPDVPIAVVIDEAVSLAKRFSTDDSGRFVNGMLSTVARELRRREPVREAVPEVVPEAVVEPDRDPAESAG